MKLFKILVISALSCFFINAFADTGTSTSGNSMQSTSSSSSNSFDSTTSGADAGSADTTSGDDDY